MGTDQRALVLFSGGLDSTVCLAWALARYAHVETVGFDYGQRHPVELEVRPQVLGALREAFADWDARLGPDHVIKLAALGQIGTTALASDARSRLADKSLPATFVPGRNLLFFTYAAAIAYRRDLQVLVGGMSETDYSDYPDSRDEVMKSLQRTLSLGMDQQFAIETPLMWLDKAQTLQLAGDVGGAKLVELIRTETHSCFMGVRDKLHAWGRGCGICPACALRAAGWDHWQATRATAVRSASWSRAQNARWFPRGTARAERMRFEHLVQINDPLHPLLEPLTRAQLWRGLVLRAEQPTQFVLGLVGCAIHGREERAEQTTLTRTLDFGGFRVHDHVVLTPLARTQTNTDAGPTWPASRLTITIEEPQPELLFLRFVYEFEGADETGELAAETTELRRQAYKYADLDTVQRIRTLAERGDLG